MSQGEKSTVNILEGVDFTDDSEQEQISNLSKTMSEATLIALLKEREPIY